MNKMSFITLWAARSRRVPPALALLQACMRLMPYAMIAEEA